MKNKSVQTIWIFNIFFLLVVIFIGTQCFLNRRTSQTNTQIQSENKKIEANVNYYKNRIEADTPQKRNQELAQQKVDFKQAKNQIAQKIKQGITLSYNDTKTVKDYSQLKNKLPKYVGQEMANKIIKMDQPVVNQSGKKSMPFNGLKDLKIAFGTYDYETGKVAIKVYVKYVTKTEAVKLPGKNAPTTKNLKTGANIFTLSANVKNSQIKLLQFEQGKAE